MKPHPRTGVRFASPVPPGTGWPGDPAGPHTPVARTAAEVEQLAAGTDDLAALDAAMSVCRACPRLVTWREEVATTRRAAFADQPYWGRPAPGFGDPAAALLVVGLAPAAHGANRTGRVFTGDGSAYWLFASLHRAGLAAVATSTDAADGQRLSGVRIAAAVRCAPPQNVPTPAEKTTCAPWLAREVELLSPGLACVLALGEVGWKATLGVARVAGWEVPRPAPRFGHGAEVGLRRPDGAEVVLVGSYHVSQRNTQTGLLTQVMFDDVVVRCRDLAGLTDDGLAPGRMATPPP